MSEYYYMIIGALVATPFVYVAYKELGKRRAQVIPENTLPSVKLVTPVVPSELDIVAESQGDKDEMSLAVLDDIEELPNLGDLKGVGPKYRELLEAAGFGDIRELAEYDTEQLVVKIAETNDKVGIVRQTPPKAKIIGWQLSAKNLML